MTIIEPTAQSPGGSDSIVSSHDAAAPCSLWRKFNYNSDIEDKWRGWVWPAGWNWNVLRTIDSLVWSKGFSVINLEISPVRKLLSYSVIDISLGLLSQHRLSNAAIQPHVTYKHITRRNWIKLFLYIFIFPSNNKYYGVIINLNADRVGSSWRRLNLVDFWSEIVRNKMELRVFFLTNRPTII